MKLLITGASGFLGWNLCAHAQQAADVWGVVNSHQIEIPSVNIIQADLCNAEKTSRILDQGFDAVIHLAAQANLNICQQKPKESALINVDAAERLATEACKRGIKFVFTSTDIVFDGTSAPYRETDQPSPINEYGRQKAMAEKKILNAHPEACICRMPLMFGPPSPRKPSFLGPMLQAMRDGKEVKLFEDEYRTPLGAASACEGLMLAVEKGKGIWHLGGAQRVSRYEFGLMAVDYFGIKNAQIIKTRQADLNLPTPRPADVSLENTKSREAGFTPKPIIEEFSKIKF